MNRTVIVQCRLPRVLWIFQERSSPTGRSTSIPASRAWIAWTFLPPVMTAPENSRELGRQEVECDSEDEVDGEQLDAFHPVRLSVLRNERDDGDRYRDRHDFERREAQVHR